MTGVKTNDPKVYAITVPRSNNPARITGPIPSHNTWGRQDSHYLKESHSSSGGKRGKRAHDRFGGGARHGPLQTVQPEAALRHLPAPPDSALFCVARQRGNWLQPQNGPKLPVRFSMYAPQRRQSGASGLMPDLAFTAKPM